MTCPRVTYAWCCILLAFAAHLKPQCKWNFDGTTFEIGMKGDNQLYVVDTTEEDNEPVRDGGQNDTLPVYIKWMFLGSAAGHVAPIFLVLAVAAMGENDFFVKKVRGLTYTNDKSVEGFVACSKTRGGCTQLWKYYFLNYVIPEIAKSSEMYDTKVRLSCQLSKTRIICFPLFYISSKTDDGEAMRNFLSSDGEAIILEEVFDAEVQAQFAAAKIDMAKGSPSATSAHQPSDRQTVFNVAKRLVKKSIGNGEVVSNHFLEAQ